MQRGKTVTHGGQRLGGVGLFHEGDQIITSQGGVEIEVEQVGGHDAGQLGEGGHVIQRRGDLGPPAAEAVVHHAGRQSGGLAARARVTRAISSVRVRARGGWSGRVASR